MLYQIYLQNGPLAPWLALQTYDKEEADQFLKSAKAQYVYLRILDDKGWFVSIRCEKRYTNGL
jgi:hypothetical protein